MTVVRPGVQALISLRLLDPVAVRPEDASLLGFAPLPTVKASCGWCLAPLTRCSVPQQEAPAPQAGSGGAGADEDKDRLAASLSLRDTEAFAVRLCAERAAVAALPD